jgi:hypothetical protein
MTKDQLKVLAAKVMSQHKTFKRGLSNQTVEEVVSALLLSASQSDKIAELEEEQVDDYLEASTYAISLFNAHYKNKADAVPIELCDTTRGVVTQIDNMVTGVIAELEKELADTENNLASLQSKFEDIETVFCDEEGCPLIEPFNGEGLSKWYKALKEGK